VHQTWLGLVPQIQGIEPRCKLGEQTILHHDVPSRPLLLSGWLPSGLRAPALWPGNPWWSGLFNHRFAAIVSV